MQHTLEAGLVSREERWCITVACRTNRLASVRCICDATHFGIGPSIERGEMVHHCGLQKERVSECVMHHWCNTLWERANYQEGRDVASTWPTRTNERVSVASVMQHTKGAGPVLRGERWCITVACRRKGLANVCCIIDATHLGSRPTIEGRDGASLWPAEGKS